MSRIRSIKPEFFSDEDIAALTPLSRLFFIGLWTESDKAGRLKDKPKTLKARILPFDKYDPDKGLKELHDAGFILRYTVDDVSYIQIRTWEEHQRPHHTERGSVIPLLSDGVVVRKCDEKTSPSNNGYKTVSSRREPSLPFLSLPFPSSLETVKMREAWAVWVNYRNEIKKRLTETTAKSQIKQFEGWGPERSIAAINHTIRNGWQGIYEPKPGSKDAVPHEKTTEERARCL